MPYPEIRVCADLEDLSRAAAKLFIEMAGSRIETSGSFCAALSGGATPRRLYELLATPPFSDQIPWGKIQLFQVDERCVPPDHPESNFRMIRQALLAPARIPRGCFYRMIGEHEDLEEAARLYAREMERVIPLRTGEFPRLDLIFLGMGSDGHTASLFPSSPALEETARWVSVNQPTQGGVQRITLTFPVLNAAAQIVFLVAGGEKGQTMQRVLQGPRQPHLLPAQGIKPVNGHTSWYVDRAAAACLAGVARSAQ